MKAYHFTGTTLRNGAPLPAIGEWLIHEGRIIPCESGLHASEHPFDALTYAPGVYLHQVELEEDLTEHNEDKWVGRRRKIVASIDATTLLREFSRWCALQVLYLWDAPPVVKEYLKTGNEALGYATEIAARAAARDAEWGTEGRAARAAAWAASRQPTEYAARAAAEYAARAAAWAAVRDTERCAARAAVRAAAWYNSKTSQRDEFQRLVDTAFAA